MERLLRINTNTGESEFLDVPEEFVSLGGRALTSRIIKKEVPANAHPLGKHNKLVIAPGLLTGTPVANSGRISVGGKSPLTGGIKESNSGGTFSQKMAKLGIKAIILEDKPEKVSGSRIIYVSKDGVRLEDAPGLSGKGTYERAKMLFETYGKDVGLMLIGPAGEGLRLASSIQFTDPKGRPARAAGRGGLGAVMGSKGIGAIVIDPKGGDGVNIADLNAFKDAAKRWIEILKSHPVTSSGLPSYGTAILINIINEAGALPTKNFRYGRFDKAGEVSGEKMVEIIKNRGGVVKEGCHPGCIIKCSQD